MIFGSDLDGVVLDIWPVLKKILSRHGYSLEYESIKSYEIEKQLNIPSVIMREIIYETVCCTDCKCYDDALEGLKRITSPIHFITSRSSKFRKETLEILKEPCAGMEYKLYHSTDEMPKSFLINLLGITHYVEDRAKYVKEIIEHTPATVFLINRPWNRHYTERDGRVKRVGGWNKILEIIGEVDN